MTAAGLGLNKFCYAGLIAAHKNKTPITADTASKVIIKHLFLCLLDVRSPFLQRLCYIPFLSVEQIIELVEQSKGWSSVEFSRDNAENVMMGVTEEELYNIPTAEYIHRKGGFIFRQLTVYHVALLACADLRNVEVPNQMCSLVSLIQTLLPVQHHQKWAVSVHCFFLHVNQCSIDSSSLLAS